MAFKNSHQLAYTGQQIISSVIILFAVIACANLIMPLKTGFSILAGCIIGIGNFFWLASTLKQGITLDKHKITGFVAVRYWMRFSIIGLIIFYLISRDIVDSAAFIVGFTLVILNIFLLLLLKSEGV